MKSSSPSANGLKALALFGILAFFVVPLVIGFVVWRYMPKNLPPPGQMGEAPSSANMPVLGAVGSACGGKDALPCMPGSYCKLSGTDPQATGTCVQPENLKRETYAAVGAPCDEVAGTVCMPTLYCRKDGGKMTCQAKGKDAPHILSVHFEGLQPQDDGTSLATNGQPVFVRVDAANAIWAQAVLVPDAGEAEAKYMVVSEGGHAATLDLPTDFTGRLIVVVGSKTGDTNSLVRRVATGH